MMHCNSDVEKMSVKANCSCDGEGRGDKKKNLEEMYCSADER